MKYKVGDKVKVRTRESMEKEFGVNEGGDILCPGEAFIKKMAKYCGKYLTISEMNDTWYRIKEGGYIRVDQMFEEEGLKKGDIVYVSDNSESECLKYKNERIYLIKTKKFYICISHLYEKNYNNGERFDVSLRKYAIKKTIEEKKERKVMMTDREYQEFKKNNNF